MLNFEDCVQSVSVSEKCVQKISRDLVLETFFELLFPAWRQTMKLKGRLSRSARSEWLFLLADDGSGSSTKNWRTIKARKEAWNV